MARVLVIGGGGREHALVEALLGAPSRPVVQVAPGNPGLPKLVQTVPVPATDLDRLVDVARGADLAVIGPEAPLVAGLADRLRAEAVPTLGPSAAAARLEGSKAFAKRIMQRAGVPTARFGHFHDAASARRFVRELGGAAVVKQDGLAAGKGVVVASDAATADAAVEAALAAGDSVVVEERLEGPELSVLALSDGARLALFPPAQDHKRLLDGDLGPNTGGMGAYAPAPVGEGAVLAEIRDRCMQPVVDALAEAGTPLVGVMYAGLMLTKDGPRVLEYNVRFGDPEAQVLLPLLAEDAFELMRAAATGALSPRALSVRPGAALTVVLAAPGYPDRPRTGAPIHGLDAIAGDDAVRCYFAGVAEGESGLVSAGGRVLALTGLGPSLADAAAAAYRAAGTVRFEGCQYRRDIGAQAGVGPG